MMWLVIFKFHIDFFLNFFFGILQQWGKCQFDDDDSIKFSIILSLQPLI